MSTFRAILHGLWRGLDGLRKFLHLLLLLILFGFVLGALQSTLPSIPPRAALVVAPEGEIVEQLSGDPIERAIAQAGGRRRSETLLWDLTEAIRGAAKDERIQAIVLDLDELDGAGQPTLQELVAAIGEFRATGKKVIAYGLDYTRDRYFIAAHADEIYVDPLGFVFIDGYERFRMYFKDALEKLGIEMNVFRVGAFKSAVEIFTRTDMSPEERKESLAYLGTLWSSYQEATTKARDLEADAVQRYASTLADAFAAAGGDGAAVALQAGLVTGVKSRLEVERRLIELVGEDASTGSFNAVSYDDYVVVMRAEKRLAGDKKPRIGVIVASGEILDGEQPPGTIGGESTARLIREARMNDKVRAVVLRVDSPGGSMFAAEQIYREIEALKAAGKPVIASMGDLAASGGYYISAPADEIWASPSTLTGSIGIFAIIPTFDRTLGKLGINVDGVGTTELSGQLRLDRPLGKHAQRLLESTVQRGYEEFLARVAAGRDQPREAIDAVAQGRVWSGQDAKQIGLVDQLGSFQDAVEAAAARAGLTDYTVEFIQPKLTWAQQLALNVKAWAIRTVFQADENTRRWMQTTRQLDPIQREVERLSRFSVPNRLYAYCFCSAW